MKVYCERCGADHTTADCPPMPPAPVKFHNWTCECGKVVSGTSTFGEHWVETMAHVVRSCPLVSKERGRKIMAMIHRDNLGEFDSNDSSGEANAKE